MLKYVAFGLAASVAMLIGNAATATEAVMVQAKDCQIIAGGPGFGTCTETHNQAGLFSGYVDEVTSLHPYLATDPQHTAIFNGNEWFSEQNTTRAVVSYYVAAVRPTGINHFVLWNEESSGIGAFDLWYGATAGDLADQVLSGISPNDNPLADYGQQYWEFTARPKVGWWTVVMSGCPQANPGSFPGCAIGEVAFGGPVPEPATWGLLVIGFGVVGHSLRRRALREVVA